MSAVAVRHVGRYEIHAPVGRGGMGVVHVGRLAGVAGFSRVVAIKQLHPEYAEDPRFVAEFLDEARLAARVRHVNVVQTVDVIADGTVLLLVLEFVPGLSLFNLMALLAGERDARMPLPIVAAIMSGVARGLHAAHNATDQAGARLELVHRDVSPQNVLVGFDGIARVIDFGIAKGLGRVSSTRDGNVKGKLAYMSPEQLNAEELGSQTDVFAAGIVLWELLASRHLFAKNDAGSTMVSVLACRIPAIAFDPQAADGPAREALERVATKALARQPSQRYASAAELADAIELAQRPASSAELELWLQSIAGDAVEQTRSLVRAVETGSTLAPGTQESATHDDPNGITMLEPVLAVPGDDPTRGDVAAGSRSGPRPPRLSRPLAGAALLALSVGVALWLLVGSHRAVVAERSPAPSAFESALPEGPPPPEDTPLVASVASLAADAAPASVRRAKPQPRSTQAPNRHSGADAGCRIEFTVDAKGAKVFREECRH